MRGRRRWRSGGCVGLPPAPPPNGETGNAAAANERGRPRGRVTAVRAEMRHARATCRGSLSNCDPARKTLSSPSPSFPIPLPPSLRRRPRFPLDALSRVRFRHSAGVPPERARRPIWFSDASRVQLRPAEGAVDPHQLLGISMYIGFAGVGPARVGPLDDTSGFVHQEERARPHSPLALAIPICFRRCVGSGRRPLSIMTPPGRPVIEGIGCRVVVGWLALPQKTRGIGFS